MPRRQISCGRSPVMSSSLNRTCPVVGLRPQITLKSVVLPAPFGPMTPSTSPRSTERSMRSRAWTPPKLLLIPRISSRAPIGSRPEPLAGQPRPFRQHPELLPHDARVHARSREALGKSTIDAGDDVLASDQPRVAHDPLGHQLRMLDAVRRVGDDARDDDLARRKLQVLPDMILVLVARVRGLERKRSRLYLEDDGRDLAQRSVRRVGPVPAPPAHVVADAVFRQAG